MTRAAINHRRAAQIVNNVAEEYADHGKTNFATKAELCETIRWLAVNRSVELGRKDAALDAIANRALEARHYK